MEKVVTVFLRWLPSGYDDGSGKFVTIGYLSGDEWHGVLVSPAGDPTHWAPLEMV